MINNELERLEARVAALEAALAFERRERAALERVVIPPVHEVREGLALVERNVELSLKHIVERIAEAVASGDGDRREATGAIYVELAGMVSLCVEAASRQTLSSINMLHQAMLNDDKVLVDRIIALESCLRLVGLYLNVRFVPCAA